LIITLRKIRKNRLRRYFACIWAVWEKVFSLLDVQNYINEREGREVI